MMGRNFQKIFKLKQILIISQEALIIIYIFWTYPILFDKDFYFLLSINLDIILIYGSMIFSIINLIISFSKNKYIIDFIVFRIGMITVFTIYMIITESICVLCIRHHIIIYLFSSIIIFLSLKKNLGEIIYEN